jgi:hypothetical protein
MNSKKKVMTVKGSLGEIKSFNTGSDTCAGLLINKREEVNLISNCLSP